MRGFEDWTLENVIKHNKRIASGKKTHLVKADNCVKIDKVFFEEATELVDVKTKYGAKKCEYDGIKFDSQKERDRYIELKLLEKGGAIRDLQLQVPFVLQDGFEFNGKKILPIKYIADFTYWANGELVIEDVKGVKTDVYELKKKMFMYRYKKYIKEI